jgi:hypothetical protein
LWIGGRGAVRVEEVGIVSRGKTHEYPARVGLIIPEISDKAASGNPQLAIYHPTIPSVYPFPSSAALTGPQK